MALTTKIEGLEYWFITFENANHFFQKATSGDEN